jgi:hypothetical protein
MSKPVKTIVTPKWQKIKAMYEAGTNGSDAYGKNFPLDGELDQMCCEFIDMVGTITQEYGYDCIIEDIKMDLWKERIWSLVENAGLLPEIAWRDDKESDRLEAKENFDSSDDEEVDLDELSKQEYGF